jgi:hypothetical protein
MFLCALRTAVQSTFPGYVLPTEKDNRPREIRLHRKHGGNGCLGAVAGDFDQDGRKDLAFLAVFGQDVHLIVALNKQDGWQVEKVWHVGAAAERSRLYVDTADPGTYEDLGLAEHLRPGQVESFTCKAEVVVTGMTESTAIAFCKLSTGWVFAWISD